MDPNAWKKAAANLRADLEIVLKDRGVTNRLLAALVDQAPISGRQATWDLNAQVFAIAVRNRPGTAKAVRAVEQRLREVYLTGPAAEAPARIRAAQDQEV